MASGSFQGVAVPQWAARRGSLNYNNNNNSSNISASGYNNNSNNNNNITSNGSGTVAVSKIKLCGYLKKKRSKVGGWRKLWFVLQDKLLLSYASKEEYDTKLVSFKDALNLMPGTLVRPLGGFRFTIETTTQAMYTFHCEDRRAYRDWITMLLESLAGGGANIGAGGRQQRSFAHYALDGVPSALLPYPANGLASVGVPAATATATKMPTMLMTRRCGPASNFDSLTQAEAARPALPPTMTTAATSTACGGTMQTLAGVAGADLVGVGGYCVRLPIAFSATKILERNGGQGGEPAMAVAVAAAGGAAAATHRHTAVMPTTMWNGAASACDLQEFRGRYSQFPPPPTLAGANNNNTNKSHSDTNNQATSRPAICRATQGPTTAKPTTTTPTIVRPSSSTKRSSSLSFSSSSSSSSSSASTRAAVVVSPADASAAAAATNGAPSMARSLLQSFAVVSPSTSSAAPSVTRTITTTTTTPTPARRAARTVAAQGGTTRTTTTPPTPLIKVIKQTTTLAPSPAAGVTATNHLFADEQEEEQADALPAEEKAADDAHEQGRRQSSASQPSAARRCWQALVALQQQQRCSSAEENRVAQFARQAIQEQQAHDQRRRCDCTGAATAEALSAAGTPTACAECKALKMVRERVQRLSVRGARQTAAATHWTVATPPHNGQQQEEVEEAAAGPARRQQQQQQNIIRTASCVERLLPAKESHGPAQGEGEEKTRAWQEEEKVQEDLVEEEKTKRKDKNELPEEEATEERQEEEEEEEATTNEGHQLEPIYAVVDLRHKYAQRQQRHAPAGAAKRSPPPPPPHPPPTRATKTNKEAAGGGLGAIMQRCNSYDSIAHQVGVVGGRQKDENEAENDEQPSTAKGRRERSLSFQADDIDGIYEDGDAFYQPMHHHAPLRGSLGGATKNLAGLRDDGNPGESEGERYEKAGEEEENIYEPINVPPLDAIQPDNEGSTSADSNAFWRYFTRLKVHSLLQLTRLRAVRQQRGPTTDYDTIEFGKRESARGPLPAAGGATSGFSTIKRKFGTHRKSMQMRVRKLCTRAYEPPPLFKREPASASTVGVALNDNGGGGGVCPPTKTTKTIKHRWKSVKVRSKKSHQLTATLAGGGGGESGDRTKALGSGTTPRKAFFGSLPRMRRQRPPIAVFNATCTAGVEREGRL